MVGDPSLVGGDGNMSGYSQLVIPLGGNGISHLSSLRQTVSQNLHSILLSIPRLTIRSLHKTNIAFALTDELLVRPDPVTSFGCVPRVDSANQHKPY